MINKVSGKRKIMRSYGWETKLGNNCDQSFVFQWILPTDNSPRTTTHPCSRKLFLVRFILSFTWFVWSLQNPFSIVAVEKGNAIGFSIVVHLFRFSRSVTEWAFIENPWQRDFLRNKWNQLFRNKMLMEYAEYSYDWFITCYIIISKNSIWYQLKCLKLTLKSIRSFELTE